MLPAGTIAEFDTEILVPPFALKALHWLQTEAKYIGRELPDFDLDEPPWPDGWKWEGKRGKLTKRVSAWLYKELGINLSDGPATMFGNHASQALIPQGTVVIVTDKFEWSPGDYGDTGSCFFKSRRQVFPFLSQIGARALHFKYPTGNQGRALVVDDDNGWPVVFNSYNQPLEWASVLAHELLPPPVGEDTALLEAQFRIDGSDDFPVFINDSKGVALLPKSEAELTGRLSRSNVGKLWRDHDGDTIWFCEMCNCRIDRQGKRRGYGRRSDMPSYDAHVCYECQHAAETNDSAKWRGNSYYVLQIIAYPRYDEAVAIAGREEEERQRLEREKAEEEERQRRAAAMRQQYERYTIRADAYNATSVAQVYYDAGDGWAIADQEFVAANRVPRMNAEESRTLWVGMVYGALPPIIAGSFHPNRARELVRSWLDVLHRTNPDPATTVSVANSMRSVVYYLYARMEAAEWQDMATLSSRGNFNIRLCSNDICCDIVGNYFVSLLREDDENLVRWRIRGDWAATHRELGTSMYTMVERWQDELGIRLQNLTGGYNEYIAFTNFVNSLG